MKSQAKKIKKKKCNHLMHYLYSHGVQVSNEMFSKDAKDSKIKILNGKKLRFSTLV